MDLKRYRSASMHALAAVSFDTIPDTHRMQHHKTRSNSQRHVRASLSNAGRSFTRKVSRTLSRTTSVRSLRVNITHGVLVLSAMLLSLGLVGYLILGLEINSSTMLSVWRSGGSQFYKNCRISVDGKEQSPVNQQRDQESDLNAETQYSMLTQTDKLFICDQLQGMIDNVHTTYADYMHKHPYPDMKRYTDMDNNTPPYVRSACPNHVPGVIKARVFAQKKLVDTQHHYCFGGTSLSGPRQCDHVVPDYTIKSAEIITDDPAKAHLPVHNNSLSRIASEQHITAARQYNGKVDLYGKKFAYKTHYYKSLVTKKSSADENDDTITLSTQGTWSRIDNIVALAQKWQGPISFALFLEKSAFENTTGQLSGIEELDNLIVTNEYVAQYVDFHLVWRDDHRDADDGAFYPINLLRNMALQPVKTSHVFIIDADIIPNAGHTRYAQWVADAEGSTAVQETDRSSSCPGLHAFVPPAVEMDAASLSRMYAYGNSPRSDSLSKSQVVQGLFNGQVKPMHQYFGPAYLPTNHYNWMSSESTTELTYLTRFEPYYIARMPIPLFNETFVNRGGNFAQQVYEMAAGGYSFFRLPDAFVVDIPHTPMRTTSAKGESKLDTDGTAQDDNQNSGRNRATPDTDVKDRNTDGTALVTENLTKQIHHNENFIMNMWSHFYEHMQRRYLSNIVSPAVAQRNFRTYRRTQDKIARTLWSTIGTQERAEK